MFQTIFYFLLILYVVYCVSFLSLFIYTIWREYREERRNRVRREYDMIRGPPRDIDITMMDLGNYERVLSTIPEETYIEV